MESASLSVATTPGIERTGSFDVLRVWAIVAVVLLHGGAGIVADGLGTPAGFWTEQNAANLYDALGRFGVDCFFMVSGALLLDPRRSFHLGRRLRRVAVPLLVWSAVYVIADEVLHAGGRSIVNGSVREAELSRPVEILRSLVTDPVAYHLWFVYALLGIYLVVPLLRPLTQLPEPARRWLVGYALLIWLVTTVGYGFCLVIWPTFPHLSSLALPDFPAGVLGVFLLGFYLTTYRPRGPSSLYAVVAVLGLAWIVLAVWNEQRSGGRNLWGYDNVLPPVLVLAVGVFLFVTAKPRTPSRTTVVLSQLSFRVYLVHVLVLQFVTSVGPTGRLYYAHPVAGVPVAVVVTLVLSFAIAWCVEQVPVVRIWA